MLKTFSILSLKASTEPNIRILFNTKRVKNEKLSPQFFDDMANQYPPDVDAEGYVVSEGWLGSIIRENVVYVTFISRADSSYYRRIKITKDEFKISDEKYCNDRDLRVIFDAERGICVVDTTDNALLNSLIDWLETVGINAFKVDFKQETMSYIKSSFMCIAERFGVQADPEGVEFVSYKTGYNASAQDTIIHRTFGNRSFTLMCKFYWSFQIDNNQIVRTITLWDDGKIGIIKGDLTDLQYKLFILEVCRGLFDIEYQRIA